MLKRTNSASGAKLLKRAAYLAGHIVPRFGTRREVIEGFIVEGRRSDTRRYATVLDLPGSLVSFGNVSGAPLTREYSAPLREAFDPSTPPPPSSTLFMTNEREIAPRYSASPDGAATAHVIGPPPPVNVFPTRLTEGTPFEGDKGVYCTSLVAAKSAFPIEVTDDLWLEVHLRPVGARDGRMGAIIHRSVLEAMAPAGHRLFLGTNNGTTPRHGLSWPHYDADEHLDGVVVAAFLRQALRADPSASEDSYCSAVVTFYLNLKTGLIEWSQVYDFTQASHPMFKREVVTAFLDGAHRPYWTEQDAGRLTVESHNGQVKVAFGMRVWRPILRQPVGGDTPTARWYIRKFFGLGVLTVTPTSVTDEWRHVDCWCSASSAAMDELSGASAAFMELVDQASPPFVFKGKVYHSGWVLTRPTQDIADHLVSASGTISYYGDYQRFYYEGQLVTTAVDSGLLSEFGGNGEQLQNPFIFLSGFASRLSEPFATWLGGDKIAKAIYRMDGTRLYAVVIFEQAEFAMYHPFGPATAPAATAAGRYGLTCPQREVRDEFGVEVSPYLLIAHAKAAVSGVETGVLAMQRGASAPWVWYTVGAYASRGVAYTGNPLMTRPYGQIFEDA